MLDKLKQLVDLLPQPIFEFDINYNITFYNKSLLHLLNLSSFGMQDMKINEYIFPLLDTLTTILNSNERLSTECYVKNDYTSYHVTMFSYPSHDETGKIKGRICTICDMTERKNIELKLREKEKIYKYIVDNSHDGIFLLKENGIIDFVNTEFLNISGYNDITELVGSNFSIFVSECDIERMREYYKNRINGLTGERAPNKYDFKLKKKDGILRDVSIHINLFTLPDGSVRVLGQLIDITEKKELGDKLAALHDIMQLIFDGMQDVIWAKDINNENVFMNKKFKEAFISEEVINNKIFNFNTLNYSDHKPVHTIEKIESHLFGVKWLDICKFPIFKDDKLIGIAGIARDITENILNILNIDKNIDDWKIENNIHNNEVKIIMKDTLDMINNAIIGEKNATR